MNRIYIIIILILLFFPAGYSKANELDDLFSILEALELGHRNYILGKKLSPEQKKIALENRIDNSTPGTYKFQDQDLFIIIDEKSDRIIIIYEQHDNASREKVEDMTGALFLEFGEPTLLAHDKLIYWIYENNGKINKEKYQKIRKNRQKISILATVKLSSSQMILGRKKEKQSLASIYYIISSESILKFIKNDIN